MNLFLLKKRKEYHLYHAILDLVDHVRKIQENINANRSKENGNRFYAL